MLAALSIRDIVLIDKLDLSFAAGLTVFTGETGAGKSIILDALSLALGVRGDGGLVRKGAQSASVTACFDLPPGHPAAGMLAAQDLDEGESLILRRVQFADGKTKAFINDRPVSTALLRELGRKLVEIHGQHDERALLDPSTHRHLLDQFGGLLPDVREVAQLWDRWRELDGKAKEPGAGAGACRARAGLSHGGLRGAEPACTAARRGRSRWRRGAQSSSPRRKVRDGP